MSPLPLIAALVAIPNGISTPPSVTQTIEAPSAPEGSGPEWTATMQAGGGRLSEDPVMMMRPRLTLTGQQARLAVSAPLFLRIADEGPVTPNNGAGPVSWTNNWRDGETYAAWLEEFQYTSKHGTVDLRLGSLRRQTLGHGTLVDNYTASYDPSQPRSGGRFVVSTDTVEAKLIADGLIRPRLLAASFTLAPFQIDNREAEDAFTVAVELAADMRAPIMDGTTQVGGADVVLTGAPYIGDELMWSLYFAMGSFYTPQVSGGMGSHLGTELHWMRGHDALLIRLEGTVSGRGYDPAYFDDQYSAERASLNPNAPTSKADIVAPAGYGTRGRIEFTNGPFTVGSSMEHSFAASAGKPTRASLYTEWTADMWHIAARISQRTMRNGGDWFSLGDRSMALVDASVRITGEWFAYTLLHHGIRQGDNGITTPVSDWILGVGYGVAGTLDRL
jgi:hypothetical protein